MADLELVIKIPSKVYENIKSATADDNDISSLLLGIHEGTPLPKGHGRLIDADELTEKLERMANIEWNKQVGSSKGLEDAIDSIEYVSTIIETDNTCSTCTHSDETDGSHCYECVKGESKYEADKGET